MGLPLFCCRCCCCGQCCCCHSCCLPPVAALPPALPPAAAEALDAGIKVAVCSTSNERAVSNIVKVCGWVGGWVGGWVFWCLHCTALHSPALPMAAWHVSCTMCHRPPGPAQLPPRPPALCSPPHAQVLLGERIAANMPVYAGDCVPKKKPAPDIYLLAARVRERGWGL
jgi:hypothetical protein